MNKRTSDMYVLYYGQNTLIFTLMWSFFPPEMVQQGQSTGTDNVTLCFRNTSYNHFQKVLTRDTLQQWSRIIMSNIIGHFKYDALHPSTDQCYLNQDYNF